MRALVLLFALGGLAHADDGLRCGEWLVDRGASETDVAAKCGPPTTSDRRHARWTTRGGTMRAVIDTWTYDKGPTDFVRTLEFHDGVLCAVAVAGYGQ